MSIVVREIDQKNSDLHEIYQERRSINIKPLLTCLDSNIAIGNVGSDFNHKVYTVMSGQYSTVIECFNTVSWKFNTIYGWNEGEQNLLCTITAPTIMPEGYTGSNTSVHFMNYHFVWCSKYRRKVIIADVELKLNRIINKVAKESCMKIITALITNVWAFQNLHLWGLVQYPKGQISPFKRETYCFNRGRMSPFKDVCIIKIWNSVP